GDLRDIDRDHVAGGDEGAFHPSGTPVDRERTFFDRALHARPGEPAERHRDLVEPLSRHRFGDGELFSIRHDTALSAGRARRTVAGHKRPQKSADFSGNASIDPRFRDTQKGSWTTRVSPVLSTSWPISWSSRGRVHSSSGRIGISPRPRASSTNK